MKSLRDYQTVKERREALEKETGVNLKHTGSFSLDETVASTRNCENMIGATQIPLGIAGPLTIQSSEFKVQNYFIPLATTEGALVASVSRGCKALFESGGAVVSVERIGATRGPVFRVSSLEEQDRLLRFLKEHRSDIKQVAEGTSHHLTFLRYETTAVGKYVYVRFYFDTGNAMGLNMATFATEAIVHLIKEKIGVECISLSGNFCTDKKASFQNFINGRGFAVSAQVVITGSVLEAVLKTTAEKIHEVWLAKCMIGSAISGSLGFNAHFANVISALFIATGQDPAHAVEGSMGITTTYIKDQKSNVKDKDLYISVYLPSVMVGTVGGGTGLATQKEALTVLGVADSLRLAEIVGGSVLAGELSLLASLSQGRLAQSHQKFARGIE